MGWLSGWSFRKQVCVSGADGAGADYQIKVQVAEALAADPTKVSLNGASSMFPSDRNDSGDIRFTLEDGVTLCPMWTELVEGTAPNREATIWLKIPVSLDRDTNLYCYFNNPNAENVSNGDAVFLLFDDFEGTVLDASKWSAGPNPNSGTIRLNENHTDDYLISNSYFDLTAGGFDISVQLVETTSYSRFQLGMYDYNDLKGAMYCYEDGGVLWGFFVDGIQVKRAGHDLSAPVRISFQYQAQRGLSVSENLSWFAEYLFGTSPAITSAPVALRSWAASDVRLDWVFVRNVLPIEPYVFWVSPLAQDSDQPAQIVGQHVVLDKAFSVPATGTREAASYRLGSGVIQGSVHVLGVPAKRRVALLDRRTLKTLAVAWSDPVTGAYEFKGFDHRFDYLVVCDDYTKTHNAAVADWVRPEVS